MKLKRWALAKVNGFVGAVFTPADKLLVGETEAAQFFSSKFFDRFSRRCRELVEPWLAVAQAEESGWPSEAKSALKLIHRKEDDIREYMLTANMSSDDACACILC